MTNQLDHIVIAHPDLDLAMREFADLTGCTPQYGGPHLGGGTHNALVSLGDSVYLELISPDPAQVTNAARSPSASLGQRLASLTSSKLLGWAIRSENLDAITGQLGSLTASKPFQMARQQPDGETLHWRLMNLIEHDLKGFAPFYIDWLDCPHPASTNPVAGEFVSLDVTHPNSDLKNLVANTSGVNGSVGAPNFALCFNTANGPVHLSSTQLQGFWV